LPPQHLSDRRALPDFGKSLINSQRPKNLSTLEIEQYNVLLEDRLSVRRKAIELHEVNAHRTQRYL